MEKGIKKRGEYCVSVLIENRHQTQVESKQTFLATGYVLNQN